MEEKNMGKKETPMGNTHVAHETRHLARKMQLVRDGKYNIAEMEAYREKIKDERDSLITRLKDSWSYLKGERIFDFTIPDLTKAEAAKHMYMIGLEPSDFLSSSKLQMHYMYGLPAPTEEHLHTATMLLQACIRDLGWAIAEINTYLTQNTDK